jgi:hypothetical protein
MKTHLRSLLACLTLATLPALAGEPATTFCNPLDLDYRIQPDEPCRREAADPVALAYKGDYFIFASKSGGYWWSADFTGWQLLTPPNLPLEAYAPAVFEYEGALYFMASGAGKLYRSTDPKRADSWIEAGTVRRDTDPALFKDDDGRIWLYYGCAQGGPIWVVELDPKHQFKEIGQPVICLKANEPRHGWEVEGDGNQGGVFNGKLQTTPWVEGAWMTRHGGKYYLQYAAPGTQWATYGDGLYVAEAPTGPFTYADYSPFSFKPTGFMTGAGHSCTFQDKDGHYWHIATGVICVRHIFERRLAVSPVQFDAQGRMSADTRFGDLPQYLPGRNPHPGHGNQTGWMLLSYRKTVTASSELKDHPASLAADENIKTWWSATGTQPGDWLQIDLGGAKTVQALQVNFAESDVTTRGRTPGFAQKFKIEQSVDGKTWTMLIDRSASTQDAPHAYFELPKPVTTRHLRITDLGTPGNGRFALRDFRIFGNGHGQPPAPSPKFTVVRDPQDRRHATIEWEPVPGADGYVVRYGIAPDALNSQYEVRGTTRLEIHSLNADTDYQFAIEPFNENGVAPAK